MARLRAVGFYKEFGGSESEISQLPSLRDCVAEDPQPDEDKILQYLRTGRGYAGRGSYEKDVLDPGARYGLVADLLTDGVYLWRADLAYYVAKYHVRLPEDFLAHARAQNWTVPVFPVETLWHTQEEGSTGGPEDSDD
jgi:hypothetical protein